MKGKVLNTISGDESVTYLKESLHNPGGMAGGMVDQITGVGDSKVNSSIGSQWKNGRADSIENQIKQSYGIPPASHAVILDDAMMNVDLF